MKKVSIVGIGWLGLPLARALADQGWQVRGSKTTPDGVKAANLSGTDCCLLQLTPELSAEPEDLTALFNADAMVVTLPVSRTVMGSELYLQAVQNLVDSALAFHVPRIVFTSSISVYGNRAGIIRENSPREPESIAGKMLVMLEDWLHDLPGTSVDILRLAGLVGPQRHPGRFLAGKTDLTKGGQGVNLVHLEDVIEAITLLLATPKGGGIYNLSAPQHPARNLFYPAVARQLGLPEPVFLPVENAPVRIINGDKICTDLGFEYRYSDPQRMPFS